LDHFISLPFGFFIPDLGFHILVALVGSTSFIESFMIDFFHEDLGTIFSFLILVNLEATFAMFLLHYVEWSGYVLHTMFPSPCILQHYVEFDTHIIVTLEKLLSVKSFGGLINHLARC
jgi:hypothetical protein